jgi:hypothetical protein
MTIVRYNSVNTLAQLVLVVNSTLTLLRIASAYVQIETVNTGYAFVICQMRFTAK